MSNLGESQGALLTAVRSHVKSSMSPNLDKKASIETTVGLFKEESTNMLDLFGKIEAELPSQDPILLASNTSRLILMRIFYVTLLKILQNYSQLDHSETTDDDWADFIETNRKVWYAVMKLMPNIVMFMYLCVCFVFWFYVQFVSFFFFFLFQKKNKTNFQIPKKRN